MKKLALLLAAAVMSIAVAAQTKAPAKFGISFGPYLQNVTEDGATIIWGTSADALSWVEIAPDGTDHFYAKARRQYFQTNLGKRTICTLHTVRIDSLDAARVYRYRVCSREVTAQESRKVCYGKTVCTDVYRRKPLRFSTADTHSDALSMLMINDIHANGETLQALLKGVRGSDCNLVFFNGDMVSKMDSEQQIVDGFLGKSAELFASEIPMYYARGNHETRGNFSDRYMDYFPTPTGMPYYAIRRGPIFFVVLDSGEDKPDSDVEYYGLSDFDRYREVEAQWLKGVLASEEYRNAPYKVVVTHVPPTSSTWHGPLEVKRLFIPLLNAADVDLMLCGHLHKYSYVSDASKSGCNFPVLINSNHHAVEFKADNDAIHLRIIDTDGTVSDTRTIQRRK